ncbi:MAG: YqeG family HAD IIIA-type phosphatase [Armatimonadota bacterium]|jgi:HAD superfamily phosphatase (TIGR01668 family)
MGLWDSFRPDEVAISVADIDLDALEQRGIRGLLIDVDNTLIAHGTPEVSPERLAWVERAVERFSVCLVSNSITGRRMRRLARAMGIPGINVWHWDRKPFCGGIRRAMRIIGTTPETTAMIGDQVMTDVIAGNRTGLYTIWVDRIAHHEFIFTRLVHRTVEKLVARRMGFWPEDTREAIPDET